MTFLGSVLIALLTGSVASAITALYLERYRVTWSEKREACLQALDLVDALLANRAWTGKDGVGFLPVLPQDRPSIVDMRHCQNALAVTCRRPEVIRLYMECLMGEDQRGDAIDDLRDAVRRECGFRWRHLERDRHMSYVVYHGGAAEAQERRGGPVLDAN